MSPAKAPKTEGETAPVTYQGGRPRAGVIRRLLRWALFATLVLGTAGAIAGVVVYAKLSADVPNFQSLADYRPRVTTRVYGVEGQLIGEYYREKRIILPYDQIPRRVVQAFLASEDTAFFDHGGIDPMGVLRAAYTIVRAGGRRTQGGSTVTQQTAKQLLILESGFKAGSAKTFTRKIREAILALRLEAHLSKEEILALYLNHIFLGNQAYGVEAAAQNYFRKTVSELNLAETALIAGLPQAPSRYSPFRHPKVAKERREYVLRRMLEDGFITQLELEEAKDTPITVYPAPDVARETTPFYTELIRQELFEKYGETKVLEEGLTVYTSVDVERYRAAEDAIYDHLRLVDKRQGYRGPLAQLTPDQVPGFLTSYTAELKYRERLEKLERGEVYVAVISAIDPEAKLMRVQVGPHSAVLPLAMMRWARKPDSEQWFDSALLNDIPRKLFAVNDVVLVRAIDQERIKKSSLAGPYAKDVPTDPSIQLVELEQDPGVQAAVLSIENDSGYVTSMIGGYDFDRSEFNRATQACRQPGSSFKPLIYAAALDLKGWTMGTTVIDAPITINDTNASKMWKPKNFEAKYVGEVTLRTALQNSMNVPAIKVLEAVTIPDAIEYAQKLGIKSPMPPEMGLVLGQGCVRMEELTEVYRLFANYGKRTPRRTILRVYDRDGRKLEDNTWPRDPWTPIGLKAERALVETASAAPQIIDRQTGFLITKMMRNVVLGGTGAPAQRLGVPVAGKTGTTNDSFDAWFVGFTTELTTAAWVGFDDYVLPMGKYEQGGRAALPIWLSYMKRAIKARKTGEFPTPAGISYVRIDPKTGKRAKEGAPGIIEAFREGTEPQDSATPDAEEFMKVDSL